MILGYSVEFRGSKPRLPILVPECSKEAAWRGLKIGSFLVCVCVCVKVDETA